MAYSHETSLVIPKNPRNRQKTGQNAHIWTNFLFTCVRQMSSRIVDTVYLAFAIVEGFGEVLWAKNVIEQEA